MSTSTSIPPIPTPPAPQTFWQKVKAKLQQPSTVVGLGLIGGGITYWFTKDASISLVVAGAISGGMNDHTTTLLQRIEGLEDAARQAQRTAAATNATVNAMSARAPR